jgi:hypothetical protein
MRTTNSPRDIAHGGHVAKNADWEGAVALASDIPSSPSTDTTTRKLAIGCKGEYPRSRFTLQQQRTGGSLSFKDRNWVQWI